MSHISSEELKSRLDRAKQQVTISGTYFHYKNPDKYYTLVDVAINESDEEVCVLYRAEYDDLKGVIFIRKIDNFLENVEVDGKTISRFNKVEPKSDFIKVVGITRDNQQRIMIVREKDSNLFQTLGGTLEDSKNPIAELRREVLEECGLEIATEPKFLFGTQAMPISRNITKTVTYLVYEIQLNGNPECKSEIEEIAWISKEEFYQMKYKLSFGTFKILEKIFD
jgi:hypothetical protein